MILLIIRVLPCPYKFTIIRKDAITAARAKSYSTLSFMSLHSNQQLKISPFRKRVLPTFRPLEVYPTFAFISGPENCWQFGIKNLQIWYKLFHYFYNFFLSKVTYPWERVQISYHLAKSKGNANLGTNLNKERREQCF